MGHLFFSGCQVGYVEGSLAQIGNTRCLAIVLQALVMNHDQCSAQEGGK